MKQYKFKVFNEKTHDTFYQGNSVFKTVQSIFSQKDSRLVAVECEEESMKEILDLITMQSKLN